MSFLTIPLLFASVFFIFVYSNSIFYTLSLLFLLTFLLCSLAASSKISVFLLLLLFIVYAGAILILIGYICAVCPNLKFSPSLKYSIFYFSIPLLILIVLQSTTLNNLNSAFSSSLFSFFYSSYGIFILSLVIIILFITLLIVTTQYLIPKGPFRSSNF